MVDISRISRHDVFPVFTPNPSAKYHDVDGGARSTLDEFAKLARGFHAFGILDREQLDRITAAQDAVDSVEFISAGFAARQRQARDAAFNALDLSALDAAAFDAAVAAGISAEQSVATDLAERLAVGQVNDVRRLLKASAPRVRTGLVNALRVNVDNGLEIFKVLDGRLHPEDALSAGLSDAWTTARELLQEYMRIRSLTVDARALKLLDGPGVRDDVHRLWRWNFARPVEGRTSGSPIVLYSAGQAPARADSEAQLRNYQLELSCGPRIATAEEVAAEETAEWRQVQIQAQRGNYA